jgi:intein/homing endonuclease
MGETGRRPEFAATMMGAVPYRDMEYAANVILEKFPEAPRIPIMTRSIRWMLEGVPCIQINREKSQIIMVPPEEREEDVVNFYERVEREDLDYFAISEEKTPSFSTMLKKIKEAKLPDLKWVAFQIAGPIVLGDSIKQIDGTPVIYHETMRDMLIKSVNMKSRWMEKKIGEMLPGIQIISDQPEPSLVSFTAAGGTGSRHDVINALNGGFKNLLGLTWVHCCANIDWTLLIDAEVDIINFDAYKYSDKAALYAEEFNEFIDKGGMIGWGIVPVIKDILVRENVHSLVKKLEESIEFFVKNGIDEEKLARSSWVLPSCETVLLTIEQSDHVFEMTRDISEIMKKKYGFK